MQASYLPAISGWYWIRDGFRLFRAQPKSMLLWTMVVSLFVLVSTSIPSIGPLPIGPFLFIVSMPMITLITLSVCRRIAAGQNMVLSFWIQPLQQPGVVKQLIWMGMLYLVLCIGTALLIFLPFSDAIESAFQAAASTQDLAPLLSAMLLPGGLFLVAYLIIAALFWHAPVLVAWHEVKFVQALFFSGIACWRNKWAFLIYGIAWTALIFLVYLSSEFLKAIGLPLELVGTLQIPINIIVASVLYCSFYPSYASIFWVDNTGTHFNHGNGTPT